MMKFNLNFIKYDIFDVKYSDNYNQGGNENDFL